MFLRLSLPLLLCGALAACQDQGKVSNTSPAAASASPSAAEATAMPSPDVGATATPEPTIETLVSRSDTLASLQARFGAEDAQPQTLDAGEGEMVSGWVLFPGDPTRKLGVYLDESGEHPDTLVAWDKSTHWTRADGVRVGMTIAELQALNGRAFGFLGFDWDYGGMVSDWRGGRLDPGATPHGSVTLCPPDNPPGDYPVGDSEFESDDARLRDAMPTVCEFSVLLPKPAASGGQPAR
jgi:hypothetical protein